MAGWSATLQPDTDGHSPPSAETLPPGIRGPSGRVAPARMYPPEAGITLVTQILIDKQAAFYASLFIYEQGCPAENDPGLGAQGPDRKPGGVARLPGEAGVRRGPGDAIARHPRTGPGKDLRRLPAADGRSAGGASAAFGLSPGTRVCDRGAAGAEPHRAKDQRGERTTGGSGDRRGGLVGGRGYPGRR